MPSWNSALLKKYIRESLLLWLAVAIALFSFAWFRVWIVGEVDTARFEQILELLPQDWRRFSPVNFEWLISYLGRTALTLDEPMILMLMGVWAIVRGSDVVSGEINRGTMEMVLAQPVSRRTIYYQHATLTVGGVLSLTLLIWLAMAIAVYTTQIVETSYPTLRVPIVGYQIPLTFLDPSSETIPMLEMVQPNKFLPGIINLFCFGLFLTSLSMLFSSWDRFRWRTLGIVVGIFFAATMLKVAAVASETFRWLSYFTFCTLYEPSMSIEVADTRAVNAWYFFRYSMSDEIVGLGPLGMNGMLLALSAACFVVGGQVFRRRDLPAPL